MFTTNEKPCQLAHLNIRRELHGEEAVPAIDLKIMMVIPHTELDQFHKGLRGALFTKADGPQGNLALEDQPVTQRFQKLATLRWSEKYEGYTADLGSEFGALASTLHPAKVDNFVFEPKDGGSVVATFRIRANVDGETVASLVDYIGQEVNLTLTPPAATGETSKPREKGPQADLVDDAEAERNRDNANTIAEAMEAGQGVDTDEAGNVVAQQREDDVPPEEDLPDVADRDAWSTLQADGSRLLILRDDGLYQVEVLAELLAERGWLKVSDDELNTIAEDDYTATLEFLIGDEPSVPAWLTKAHGKAKVAAKPKASPKATQATKPTETTKDGHAKLPAVKKTTKGKRIVD